MFSSSTKNLFTGHLLGAAGAVEAIFSIEALRHNYIPMTAGICELSKSSNNVVYGQGQEAELEYAISNTFGFGGYAVSHLNVEACEYFRSKI